MRSVPHTQADTSTNSWMEGHHKNDIKMNKNNSSSGGIGFLGLLAIIFIVLKLCNVIAWSWWWVLCPLWGPLAVIGLVVGLVYAWSAIAIKYFSTPLQKEQMKRIIEVEKKNAGKSKWQIRLEQMQEAQKKAIELKEKRGY